MTDRYNGFYVALEHDIRSDDAETLISAIKQLRGVLSVKPNVAGFDEHIAEMRVRTEFTNKILKVLNPELYGDDD